ncbi:DUF418 domain-containing protein [Salirhabdus salicampi]|uniref:DUF418 domain-containing protein n=1 Tax=Salirhabdus salicampi TaxID=476102 RepID=UPI0020C5973F|nr:DUF418 domain-containing protein [Salirhabdus salicampi]MCP8615546.1 DUF418 domain-containing protein [Salirhabdus salicampi]
MNGHKPIREEDRLNWIDAVRGFALFGILMVNVPAFHAPFFLYGGEEVYWNAPIDKTIQVIIDIFFQASFYTLFSLLFGFGLQMMRERAADRANYVSVVIVRRLFILIGLGISHSFLLWHGDILLSYGIIGFLLLFFFKRNVKTIYIWGLALIVIPSVVVTWLLYSVRNHLDFVNNDMIQQAFERYQSSSITTVLAQNYEDWLYVNDGMGYIFLMLAVLPMFLIGIFIWRKGWLHDVIKHKVTLQYLCITSFVIALLFKAGPYLLGNPSWLGYIQDHIGGAASSVFYLTSITLLYQNRLWQRLLVMFTYVGRLSLTNYVSQSIICFFLFYGPGLGLYGQVRPIGSVIIVFVIFIFQVILSKWWLTYFHFGPLEWLWRTLTYGQKQSFKRKKQKT